MPPTTVAGHESIQVHCARAGLRKHGEHRHANGVKGKESTTLRILKEIDTNLDCFSAAGENRLANDLEWRRD